MRMILSIAVAGLLLAPAAVSAKTFIGSSLTAKSIEMSAAKKKKKEKVEYMKSAAGPEPKATMKSHKKKKKKK
jgi:hypothetical protein